MLKSSFINEEPKFLNHRVYKIFSYENFKGDLCNALGMSSDSFDEYDHKCTTKLNKDASEKKMLIRGNSKPHIYENLLRAIMRRSRILQIKRSILMIFKTIKDKETM